MPATPKSRKTDAQRVTGARVLTSAQGLAILKEKEEKKKKEAEEKEKRKQERVDKKKQREELAKKKAEERAKKAQEKKNASSQRKPVKRKSTSQPKGLKLSKLSSTSSTSTSTSVSPGEPSSNSTDTECCECSRTYNEDVRQGTGVEWVQCGCGRWLHEECIDSVIQDADGQERFCSFCVV